MDKFRYFKYGSRKYGSRVKLCYMDTNNSAYEIETEVLYRDIAKIQTQGLIQVDIQRMTTGHFQ